MQKHRYKTFEFVIPLFGGEIIFIAPNMQPPGFYVSQLILHTAAQFAQCTSVWCIFSIFSKGFNQISFLWVFFLSSLLIFSHTINMACVQYLMLDVSWCQIFQITDVEEKLLYSLNIIDNLVP